ncbi:MULTISPECIES: caspase family protein [unclassified Janthinobacterium]|uniref:caspase family protein n=1 Tax=unclassified Janthinobacterium TaxID=2610881 RepID=UPI00160F6083|nr:MULTISPECIES: caspase family protein [unclassified Janthinobacterium]MBB5609107.1 hypothetical protein [Janthinobacterium sp. S3T4]MBB5614162.1 hypothetical protein [Janthinobacterium sp. S3M3]
MMKSLWRSFAIFAMLLLGGCAANQLPGYQPVYYSYEVPPELMQKIAVKFKQHGLSNAAVVRDQVGRVRLAGSYQNELEVERAFVIAQSVVGLKTTSPIYPDNIKERHWERDAQQASAAFFEQRRALKSAVLGAPQKRALVVGINEFRNGARISAIQGEDDAREVARQLGRAGYQVTSLFGEQATKANIEAKIVEVGNSLQANDSLFIYVSSHGTTPVPSPNGLDQRRMSIVAYDSGSADARGGDRQDFALQIQESSVSDTLVQQLAQKPSRETRVFIDTCYSGEMLNDVQDESTAFILKANNGQPEREGVSLGAWTGEKYTAKAIVYSPEETAASDKARRQGVPQKIDRSRSGYTVITATSAGQIALGPVREVGEFVSPLAPTKKLRGSFFTQAFFAYLEQSKGEIEPAFEHARDFTSATAQRVSGGKEQQTPRKYTTFPAKQDNLYL